MKLNIGFRSASEGRYHTEICLTFSNRKDNRLTKIYGTPLLHSYFVFIKKGNLILGRNVLAGDRLDGWADHTHYIALLKNKIIGLYQTENGWHGHFCYGRQANSYKE